MKNTEQDIIFRCECAKRGWNCVELARRAGISLSSVIHLFNSRRKSSIVRLKIEHALGTPIFSTAEEYEKRKRFSESLGFNPFILKRKRIVEAASQRGVELPGYFSRRKLIAALAAHVEKTEGTKDI